MSVAVAITRTDLSATELRMAAAATRDANVARRLLALALVLEGVNRTEAARLCGMDRQTLRDWVHRYNEEGPDGLCNRALSGRLARLTQAQQGLVADWINTGADLGRDGVIRWRRIDIKRRMETELARQCLSKRLVRCCAAWVSATFRCGRATQSTTQPPRRRIKKLCRPGGWRRPGGRAQPAARNLVAGRG